MSRPARARDPERLNSAWSVVTPHFQFDRCGGAQFGVRYMAYAVKEIFLTLQGEGAHTGRVAVFCRFAGCNLWSGREVDRGSAQCRFCDTDFVGTDGTRGGQYASARQLVDAIEHEWGADPNHRFVVLTGGEPLLQVDDELLAVLHARGFAVAVETNGTIEPPAALDWLCVSPKAGSELRIREGHELKLVFLQPGAPPEAFADLAFERFSLQPMDGPNLSDNTALALAYCLAHPQWRLSMQTHKVLRIR
jgi:7-carboxy-7-deazaguanine synthase